MLGNYLVGVVITPEDSADISRSGMLMTTFFPQIRTKQMSETI